MSEPRYLNRALTWLGFNGRVLEEAQDEASPVLERARFLGIFASNLDEFFMIRVAGLRELVRAGLTQHEPDGSAPAELLTQIANRSRELCARASALYKNEIRPALRTGGVRLVAPGDLESRERAFLDRLFASEIFPVLTPAAIDPALPFPHVTNLVLYLAVRLEKSGEEDKLAIVQLPRTAARWIQVAGRDEVRFVLLEDVVREHIGELFGGHTVAEVITFRVTRDADFATDDQEAEDLVDAVRQVLRSRLAGDPVRLEIEEGASDGLVERLAGALGLVRGRCLPVAGAARPQVPHRLRAHSDAAGPARGGVDASAAARHPAGRRDLGRDRRAGHPALSSLREF